MAYRTLLPYALGGLALAVAASVATLVSVSAPLAGPAEAEPAASPEGEPAPRVAVELPADGRLAYWRDERLWASGADGSMRRPLSPIDDLRRVVMTRWSPDGSAIAFVDSNVLVTVERIDGRRSEFGLPRELRQRGYRIADIRWSPDSGKLAATMLRPSEGRSDAFVADVTRPQDRPSWTRLTSVGDVFVADWISSDELLVWTAGGVLAVVRADAENDIRLLTGISAVTPVVGNDGRIHFLSGRIQAVRDPSAPYVHASGASVWSVDADGRDLRRETSWLLDDVRLAGELPDTRYLVHQAALPGLGIAGAQIEPLPDEAGVIERLEVAADGRTAYAFSFDRVIRIDLERLAQGTPSAATVFLDASRAADLWTPARTAVQRSSAAGPAEPGTRLAFRLGGHIWTTDRAGRAAFFREATRGRRSVELPLPVWSPDGGALAVVEHVGPGSTSTSLIPIIAPVDGEEVRLSSAYGSSTSVAWSPDGAELAVAMRVGGENALPTNVENEIRFFSRTDGTRSRSALPGNEVDWTSAGLFVIRGTKDGRTVPWSVELLELEGGSVTVVTAERLGLEVGFGLAPARSTPLTELKAASDGSFVSVRLGPVLRDEGSTHVVALDGSRRLMVPGRVGDAAWSPRGALFGYTRGPGTPGELAVVHDPAEGTLAEQRGRFAGWSPDGERYYVARADGLYAYPLEGGDATRIGVIGVPVSAAR